MPTSQKPKKKYVPAGVNPSIRRRGKVTRQPGDPKRVAMTFCSGDMIHADMACALVLLNTYTRREGVYTLLSNPKASTIDLGRTNGVKVALEMDVDYLFFVDSDVMVPPQSIVQLMSHGKDVVGASYCQRRLPYKLVHTDLDGEVGKLAPTDTGIREVARMPTGCLLIDMNVFRHPDAEDPYFRMNYPGGGRIVSEDNFFCDTARKNGFSVWLDCDLTREVTHLGQYPYRFDDALQT